MVRWLHPIAISMQTMGHVEHMPYSALPQKPLAPQHKSPGAIAAWEWGAVQAGGKWGCIQKRGLTQSDKRATGFSFLRQYPHLSSCWLLFICNMLTDNAAINVDIKKRCQRLQIRFFGPFRVQMASWKQYTEQKTGLPGMTGRSWCCSSQSFH